MTIVQIGKMIQRTGNIGDLLPGVLDEAELGFASDANRMFVGSAGGGNVIEVLTSYSNISFGQLTGASNIGLDITAATEGQVLAYDSATSNWVNRGGTAGNGVVNLGNVSNVRIGQGAIGYVLETDGYGNLSWTSKGTITAKIRAFNSAPAGIMIVDPTTPYVNFNEITISGVQGAGADTVVNGKRFYIKVAVDYPTSGKVELYSDALCTIPVDTSALTATPNTGQAVSRVGSLANFAGGVNGSIQFNNGGILDGAPGLTFNPVTGTLSANYFTGNSGAAGTNTQVQFNNNGSLAGNTGFTYNAVTGLLNAPNVITGTIGDSAVTRIINLDTGEITGQWTLVTGASLQATYADLAEVYISDGEYEPGTVLEFGGTHEVTLAADETRAVAGVVTTNPAYVMNSNCRGEHTAVVALIGRVPCKVRGIVRKGDLLCSGGGGYARPTREPRVGTIVGKALEDYNGTGGVIEIVVGRC